MPPGCKGDRCDSYSDVDRDNGLQHIADGPKGVFMGKKKNTDRLDDISGLTTIDLLKIDIDKIPRLSQEEINELVLKAQNGDEAAKDKVWRSNIGLVLQAARKKSERDKRLSLEDFVQEGVIGLGTAIDKFDPSRGNMFSTYAVYWIYQAMGKAAEKKGRTITLPASAQEKIRKLLKAQKELEQELQRDPTIDDYVRKLDMPVEDVIDTMINADMIYSLDYPMGEDEEETLLDLISNKEGSTGADSGSDNKYSALKVRYCLLTLSDRERFVLIRRYGLDGMRKQTLEELGIELGVTRERVRQIQAKATRKFVDRFNNMSDDDF